MPARKRRPKIHAMRSVREQPPQSHPAVVREARGATDTNTHGCRVFDRVVCAVDRSPRSLEAVRQACVLGEGVGQIEFVGIVETVADDYSAYRPSGVSSEATHSWAGRGWLLETYTLPATRQATGRRAPVQDLPLATHAHNGESPAATAGAAEPTGLESKLVRMPPRSFSQPSRRTPDPANAGGQR